MRVQKTALIAATMFVLAAPAAWAQAPSTPPPSWDKLTRCAEMTDAADELACYRSAMRDAGFKPNVQAAEAQRRRKFGLSLPGSNKLKDAPREKDVQTRQAEADGGDDDVLSVELAQVALIPPFNKLLLVTADGAIWEQQDTVSINPRPKKGQRIEIRRSKFGGYFCKFDRVNSVRCDRTR